MQLMAPSNYLVTLFLIAPLHLVAQYFTALSFERVNEQLGNTMSPVTCPVVMRYHGPYTFMVVVMQYINLKQVISLRIQNRIVMTE